MPLTWAREHGIDTRIPGFAHHDQDGDGVSTLMEWKHGTQANRPTFTAATPAILVAMKEVTWHTLAHLRLIAPICILPSGRAGGESLPRPPSERLQKSATLPTRLASPAHSFRPRPSPRHPAPGGTNRRLDLPSPPAGHLKRPKLFPTSPTKLVSQK